MKLVYADYAAATPTDPNVVEAMRPYWTDIFANPSSAHGFGGAVWSKLHDATEQIALFLNCDHDEIIYTSGGTESNNLAILGVAKTNKNKGQHIITTAIEHPSILNACKALEKDGWSITYLPVTDAGLVEPAALSQAITKETVLISIHLANSELGVIQDIPTLASIAKKAGVYFHTDACQAGAFIDLNIDKLGVDLLTFNGGKIYGPKGVAVLYVRQGVQIFPIIYGGGQQNSLRSGTENVPGIVGLAAASQIAAKSRGSDSEKIGHLRNQLQQKLEQLPGVIINSYSAPRLPNHLSVTFGQTQETNLVAAFNRSGVGLSSGSACSSKSIVDSHVLQAIGLSSEAIHRTIRVSLGRSSTAADINSIAKVASSM